MFSVNSLGNAISETPIETFSFPLNSHFALAVSFPPAPILTFPETFQQRVVQPLTQHPMKGYHKLFCIA